MIKMNNFMKRVETIAAMVESGMTVDRAICEYDSSVDSALKAKATENEVAAGLGRAVFSQEQINTVVDEVNGIAKVRQLLDEALAKASFELSEEDSQDEDTEFTEEEEDVIEENVEKPVKQEPVFSIRGSGTNEEIISSTVASAAAVKDELIASLRYTYVVSLITDPHNKYYLNAEDAENIFSAILGDEVKLDESHSLKRKWLALKEMWSGSSVGLLSNLVSCFIALKGDKYSTKLQNAMMKNYPDSFDTSRVKKTKASKTKAKVKSAEANVEATDATVEVIEQDS